MSSHVSSSAFKHGSEFSSAVDKFCGVRACRAGTWEIDNLHESYWFEWWGGFWYDKYRWVEEYRDFWK